MRRGHRVGEWGGGWSMGMGGGGGRGGGDRPKYIIPDCSVFLV